LIQEVYKKHLLTIDISARTRQIITTNTTFWTLDIGVGKLKINFVSNNQPVNLTGATVLLGFNFENGDSKLVDSKDGSVVIEDVQQGRCHVIMPSYKINYSGPVLIHVYILYETGKMIDCAAIATEFNRSWLDQKLPEMEEYYVKRIEDWLTEIEAETNNIKGELESRLNDLREEIINTQVQIKHMQDQINANEIVTHDELTHGLSTKLSITGGSLTGDLDSTGSISTSHPNGLLARNLTTQHDISISYLNEIPRLKIDGAESDTIPFEIQTTQDRIMMTLTLTRLEVPGRIIAGDNITTPFYR